MKFKFGIIAILLIVVIAAVLAIYAWNTKPELVQTYPMGGDANAPATTGIRLVFSRPMVDQSVIERLKISPATSGGYTWDGTSLNFTPDQAWPSGEVVTVTLEAGSRGASWITFPMGGKTWSFTIGESMLAYLWPADKPADIYALTPSTGKITRYTHDMAVLDFSLSNDGLLIYFSASNAQEGADIYKIDRTKVESSGSDTYQPQQVLICGEAQCRYPVISADKQYLAYEYIQPEASVASGPAQIWMLNLASAEPSALGLEGHETVQPTWSSTGWLAYYDSTASGYEFIEISSMKRTLLSNLTGQPGEWSPAGNVYLAPEVYYYQAPENTERGTSQLRSYQVLGGTSEDISKSVIVEDTDGVYSPDGSMIAFARKFLDAAQWTLGRQLWIMNPDGSNAHAISDEPDYNHYDIAWSQDGTRLAYVRFDESRVFNPPELWMVNVDGSNPIQLVIGGYSPVWIP
ncbi:MAG: hypothetical protein C3F13_17725 [Anaerolineales bacterium]|nr:hypothetical protein [Anaerolineae bacterium]PWB50301.1 MAG: hypothetical protein C3F13_17725 [Anaerolineales bacterium]